MIAGHVSEPGESTLLRRDPGLWLPAWAVSQLTGCQSCSAQ